MTIETPLAGLPEGEIRDELKDKERPEVSDHLLKTMPGWFVKVMNACLNIDPEDRPSMGNVVGMFMMEGYKKRRGVGGGGKREDKKDRTMLREEGRNHGLR